MQSTTEVGLRLVAEFSVPSGLHSIWSIVLSGVDLISPLCSASPCVLETWVVMGFTMEEFPVDLRAFLRAITNQTRDFPFLEMYVPPDITLEFPHSSVKCVILPADPTSYVCNMRDTFEDIRISCGTSDRHPQCGTILFSF